MVFEYQKQFLDTATSADKNIAAVAGVELIKKFYPLFKKYLIVLKSGQINFHNSEQKSFIKLFMPDKALKNALGRKRISKSFMDLITNKFNFIVEAYGFQDEDEIEEDLHMLFFVLVKRYKAMGKSFCCYVFNAFKYEVARHIMAYQKNPANFRYKNTNIDDIAPQFTVDNYDEIEDRICEDDMGLPDKSWISGEGCSELFASFTPTDRIIFSKYYLQDWNDGQIAELLGLHINTANQKRKEIVKELCEKLGVDPNQIKRHRKSGKKAVFFY